MLRFKCPAIDTMDDFFSFGEPSCQVFCRLFGKPLSFGCSFFFSYSIYCMHFFQNGKMKPGKRDDGALDFPRSFIFPHSKGCRICFSLKNNNFTSSNKTSLNWPLTNLCFALLYQFLCFFASFKMESQFLYVFVLKSYDSDLPLTDAIASWRGVFNTYIWSLNSHPKKCHHPCQPTAAPTLPPPRNLGWIRIRPY